MGRTLFKLNSITLGPCWRSPYNKILYKIISFFNKRKLYKNLLKILPYLLYHGYKNLMIWTKFVEFVFDKPKITPIVHWAIENDLDCPWATRNHPHCWFIECFLGNRKWTPHSSWITKQKFQHPKVVARNNPHHPWQSQNDLHPCVGFCPKQSKTISIIHWALII